MFFGRFTRTKSSCSVTKFTQTNAATNRLQDGQARSTAKIEYHANVALTAINIAKFEHWVRQNKQHPPFSMADVKALYHNQLLIERFFTIFPNQAELIKNDPKIKKLYNFGLIAA